MKLPLTIFPAIIALACALAGCTSSDSQTVAATRERFLELPIEGRFLFGRTEPGTVYIRRGDSRDSVVLACGRPASAINANLWVYRDCYSASEAAREADCDTLLVSFSSDRVTALKLVNSDVLHSELAKQGGTVDK